MTARELITQWRNGVRINHQAHAWAALRFQRRESMFGLPVVIITAVIGTSLFGDLTKETVWKFVIGGLSVLTTVLASAQALLKNAELAEQHKAAALQYGKLRRRIEILLATDGSEKSIEAALPGLQEEWDGLDAQSPMLPQDLVDQALAGLKSKGDRQLPEPSPAKS